MNQALAPPMWSTWTFTEMSWYPEVGAKCTCRYPICEYMGLSFAGQRERIGDPALSGLVSTCNT